MGTLSTNACLITGVPVTQNFATAQEGFDYKVVINNKAFIISLPSNFQSQFASLMYEDGYKLKGLLFNGVWIDQGIQLTLESARRLLAENYFPISPEEKLEALLEYFYKAQPYDGGKIMFQSIGLLKDFGSWIKFYFKNKSECIFYIKQLHESGFANVIMSTGAQPISISLSLEGLSQMSKIIEGKSSDICFVAMAFDKDLEYIYTDAIKIAIEETGFKPLIIKDEHLPSDVTINDGILSGIKKAKFMIADFTRNKRGVYFEAGFALGRGQKVIYTCKDDSEELKELHFDTNHYQHILWKNKDDLKQKLIDKIEVFIKP